MATALLLVVTTNLPPISPGYASPPSPPPKGFHDTVDWLLLAQVLGGMWTVTMLAVFASFFCLRSRRSEQSAGLAGQIEAGSAAVTVASPKPLFRTVNRGRSAVFGRGGSGSTQLEAIERSIKMAFVRKVYTILSTQLAITFAIVLGFIYSAFEVTAYGPDPNVLTDFGRGLLGTWWLIYVALIPLLIILCALHALKNTYPLNFVLLFIFTGIESAILGIVCVMYYMAGFGDQIILAAAITIAIFLVLTLYTMQSKIDWSFLGPMLTACLFILIFWSWFSFWLLPVASFRMQQVFSLFGAMLFCGFIVYDTNMIMKHMGVDDYIIAAIELYLDIINLFQYLLALLTSSRSD